MRLLAGMFPSMRGIFDGGWSVEALRQWWMSGAPTGGSRHVAMFLLQVWNMHTTAAEWRREGFKGIEPFNAVAALGTWDDAHRSAFVTWCQEPFFP